MTYMTAAGSALAIGATAPTTFDAAGYAALTLTEIGGPESIGTIGTTFAEVPWQPLKGPKDTLKGSQDNNALTPNLGLDRADAGQILLRTASNDKTQKLYPFKYTYPNGDKEFFMGRVFGMPSDVGNADSVITAKPTVRIISDVVFVAAT